MAAIAEGARTFDEPAVDGLKHSLQCATILAREYPDDEELIAAGLVHDVATIASGENRKHDEYGAHLVGPLLGPRVAKLVGAHVAAKRYLVTTDPAYRDILSEGSVMTLLHQGELLGDDEIAALERDPDFEAIVALRRADDRAKDPNATAEPLEAWRPLLTRLSS
jgi:predicted HD phosphohydrolase